MSGTVRIANHVEARIVDEFEGVREDGTAQVGTWGVTGHYRCISSTVPSALNCRSYS